MNRLGCLLAVLALTAGCTATPEVTAPTSVPPMTLSPAGYASPGATSAPVDCSANPPAPPDTDRLRVIRGRGHLLVGISQTTYQLSHRDLRDGRISGFEIDLVRAIATELLGPTGPDQVQYVVLPTDKRLDSMLEPGPEAVDLVVADVSYRCEREVKYQIAYSTRYLRAPQKLLVRQETDIPPVVGISALAGKRICAAGNTTSMDYLRASVPEAVSVSVSDSASCMILLQRGEIYGIFTSDVILAGLADQDTTTRIVDIDPADPRTPAVDQMGVVVRRTDRTLLAGVNAAIGRVRADGSLQASYDRYFNATGRNWRDRIPAG
ncbi:transporter substrate-binding domain-containing protein [Actinokineospora sp. NBRC 105648]|uniref:transporter substrate-binding domain-containing protein n=1 Tax=Actinokineospora sp. NBRC 105648 TaxID=3032206 RepID=UPI0024A3F263|nr:transporter substrate-binding domain-containing protein [Actinokineospora sp. NBRC 105648]GLZ40421.1 ABC transporter substrate-binding protein [Actinokineospora sp. NBRC 105648]